MAQINAIPSAFLVEQFSRIEPRLSGGKILDLACGSGRNGLHLVEAGHPVVFADKSHEQLQIVQKALRDIESKKAKDRGGAANNSSIWQIDFEEAREALLPQDEYELVLVFNYLHRPLMPELLRSVAPGGYLIYQTFTLEQPRFGRPTNRNFLLQPGELLSLFEEWELIHSFEGLRQILDVDGQGTTSACANIVVRRPVIESEEKE